MKSVFVSIIVMVFVNSGSLATEYVGFPDSVNLLNGFYFLDTFDESSEVERKWRSRLLGEDIDDYKKIIDAIGVEQMLGTETGNGGDEIRDFFIHEAIKLMAVLEKRLVFRLYYGQFIWPMDFSKKINIKNIKLASESPLIDNGGSVVSALVLDTKKQEDLRSLKKYTDVSSPYLDRYLILDSNIWRGKIKTYGKSPFPTQRLIIHEILRLNNVKDDNYIVTEQIIKQMRTNVSKLPNPSYKMHIDNWLNHPDFKMSKLSKVNPHLAKEVSDDLIQLDLASRFKELVFFHIDEGKLREYHFQGKGDLLESFSHLIRRAQNSIDSIEIVENNIDRYQYSIEQRLYSAHLFSDRLRNNKIKLLKTVSFLFDQYWGTFLKIFETMNRDSLLTRKGVLFCENQFSAGDTQRVRVQSTGVGSDILRVILTQKTRDPVAQVIGGNFRFDRSNAKNNIYGLVNLTGESQKSRNGVDMILRLNQELLKEKDKVPAHLVIYNFLNYKDSTIPLFCTNKSEGVDVTRFHTK